MSKQCVTCKKMMDSLPGFVSCFLCGKDICSEKTCTAYQETVTLEKEYTQHHYVRICVSCSDDFKITDLQKLKKIVETRINSKIVKVSKFSDKDYHPNDLYGLHGEDSWESGLPYLEKQLECEDCKSPERGYLLDPCLFCKKQVCSKCRRYASGFSGFTVSCLKCIKRFPSWTHSHIWTLKQALDKFGPAHMESIVCDEDRWIFGVIATDGSDYYLATFSTHGDFKKFCEDLWKENNWKIHTLVYKLKSGGEKTLYLNKKLTASKKWLEK